MIYNETTEERFLPLGNGLTSFEYDEKTQQVNGKYHWCNGNLNFNLALTEALHYPDDVQKELTRSISRCLDNFTKTEKGQKDLETFTEKHGDLNGLESHWKAYNYLVLKHNGRVAELQREQGRNFNKATRACQVGGTFEMDAEQLIGYLEPMGSWNDFDYPKIKSAIRTVESHAPRQKYGVNNPNTGLKDHKWGVVRGGATIFFYTGFIGMNGEKKVEQWNDFEKTVLRPIFKDCKVDEYDFEIEYVEALKQADGSDGVPRWPYKGTLRLWWD